MKRRLLLLLALCLGLSSCRPALPGDRQYRGGLQHTGFFPAESIEAAPSLQDRYGLVNCGTRDVCESSPTVYGDTLYVGADNGYLYALNRHALQVQWQFKVRAGGPWGIHTTAAVDKDRVYIGAYDGWVYALNRTTSHLVWQTKVASFIGSSVALCGDRLYVGVETAATRNSRANGFLVCLERNSGHEVFRSPLLGGPVYGTPTISEERNLIFIGCNNSSFFALHQDDGGIAWYYRSQGAIKSTAALAEDRVLFTSWDGSLYCLGQSDGHLLWKYATGGRSLSSPAVDTVHAAVFAGSNDRSVYGIDLHDGHLLWAHRTAGRVRSSGTIVRCPHGSGQVFVIGSDDGNLYGLDTQNGDVVFQFGTQGSVSSVPTIAGGDIFLSGDDGWLYRLH